MISGNFHPSEIEAIFQKCNYHFSIGETTQAHTWFEMLNYIIDENYKFVNDVLSSPKKKRFSYIQDYFDGIIESTFLRKPKSQNIGKNKITENLLNEEDIKIHLNENINELEKTTGKLKFLGTERRASLEEKHRCDLLYVDNNRKLYVIELKKDLADHGVVTQIDKYLKYFWCKAFIGYFDDIQGVVISGRYSNYAYDNLKNNNILCFQYKKSDKFSLLKI